MLEVQPAIAAAGLAIEKKDVEILKYELLDGRKTKWHALVKITYDFVRIVEIARSVCQGHQMRMRIHLRDDEGVQRTCGPFPEESRGPSPYRMMYHKRTSLRTVVGLS